jgi:hypothetical protein
MAFAIKRSRRRDAIAFENADVRGAFDDRAPAGWKLELTFRATYLATHSLEKSIDLATSIASGFGNVAASRLRRFDLAVDVVGFPLSHNDNRSFVTRRANVSSFAAEAKDFDDEGSTVVMHRNAAMKVTGFSIAKGNPLMARIYDKTEELTVMGSEEKQQIESVIWRSNGWNGVDQVTRVEFQHRGEYLDEIRLRDIDKLTCALDAVWQRDVQWLRLVDLTTATRRQRCKLDPRWQAVSNVVFRHAASPIPRHRIRGGATPEHVLGATRSRLAASGQLRPIQLGTAKDGRALDEYAFAYQMSDGEARAWLRSQIDSTCASAARDIEQSLRTSADPRETVACFIAKHNSTVARFSSSDDSK